MLPGHLAEVVPSLPQCPLPGVPGARFWVAARSVAGLSVERVQHQLCLVRELPSLLMQAPHVGLGKVKPLGVRDSHGGHVGRPPQAKRRDRVACAHNSSVILPFRSRTRERARSPDAYQLMNWYSHFCFCQTSVAGNLTFLVQPQASENRERKKKKGWVETEQFIPRQRHWQRQRQRGPATRARPSSAGSGGLRLFEGAVEKPYCFPRARLSVSARRALFLV